MTLILYCSECGSAMTVDEDTHSISDTIYCSTDCENRAAQQESESVHAMNAIITSLSNDNAQT